MYNLAMTLVMQDKLERPGSSSNRPWRCNGASSGQIISDTLDSMDVLAEVLRAQGRLEEARKLHEQVLEAKRRTLGPDHRTHSIRCTSSLVSSFKQNELEKADELCEHVVETRWQTLGPCHLDTLDAVEDLIEIRARQEGSTEAPKFSETKRSH